MEIYPSRNLENRIPIEEHSNSVLGSPAKTPCGLQARQIDSIKGTSDTVSRTLPPWQAGA